MLLQGTVVAERFRIQGRAGSGGMAMVYRAEDTATGEIVAVKILRAAGDDDRRRFEREARILSDIRHPGIVRYVQHGALAEGNPYLAMEWLDGEDLAQRLERRGLTLADSIAVCAGAAEALGVAHEHGVIHRDIKPSNLFLVDGRVDRIKLLDFGVARVRASAMTRTHTMLGTPGYVAPEQARGEARTDQRADIFSLGCVLFECLSGRPPFAGDHIMAVLAKILFEDPPALAGLGIAVPAELDDVLGRMLAKDPARRPRTCAGVVRALTAAAAAAGTTGRQARAPVVTPPGEITVSEQRLMSVVLACPQGESGRSAISLARTLRERDPAPELSALRQAVGPLGGRLECLADGSLVLTHTGTGAATDQVARAARSALLVRAHLPGAAMALATGRGQLSSPGPTGEAPIGEVPIGEAPIGEVPIGEVIDRAARLVRAPRPGARSIPIDEVTAGLLDGRFDVGGDDAGLELRGESREREVVRTFLGKPTPCVGRERELAMLDALFGQCVADSECMAVVITGPAGLGKSRLRYEFLRRVREREREGGAVTIFHAIADPSSAGSAFALLAQALRRAAGLREGEPVEVRRQKLRARVGRHMPAPASDATGDAVADAATVAEFLGELMGVPFPDQGRVQLAAARQDPTLMGDQMRRAWEDFLAAECAVQPVIVVLEDLHWGDLPTVKLMDAALRHLRERPFLVLAIARPEMRELFPDLWSQRHVVEIAIRELSTRASERLVRAALGDGASAETVALIVERAAGNAFYLEELIRAVVEGRGSALPGTVLAMVQARVEGLEDGARRLLRAASVFGRIFWREGAMALLGEAARTRETVDWLVVLEGRELVTRRSGSSFPGRDEYRFRHSLVREAAYAMLTEGDRALGHRLAGEWLERAGERDAMVLAEHFERGGLPERAIGWLGRGAEQALEGHDFEAAIIRAGRGIASGARDEVCGAMHLVRAEAYQWTGRFVNARDAALEAMVHLQPGTTAWFRAGSELIAASARRGEFHVAVEWADRARGVEAENQARSAQVICLCAAARALMHAGEYRVADALIERIATMGEGIDSQALGPRALAELHRLRGARARQLGDLMGDLIGYRAALAGFEQAGDARNACNAQVSLGFARAQLGDLDGAEAELEHALASAGRMGLDSVITRMRQNLGLVLAARGELDRARELERMVIDECLAQGNRRFEGWTRVYAAVMAWRAGDHEAAEREAGLADELLFGTPPARAGALAARARALVALGRHDDALPLASLAVEILEAYGGIEEFEPLVRLAYAEAAYACGDMETARRVIGVACGRVREHARCIEDAAMRERFLGQVPENREILELAARWQIEARPAG